MKRRKFLKNASKLSMAPLVLNGTMLQSFAAAEMLPLLNCQGIDERVLVIVFLKGANDGINTIIPISQYDTYANIRPDIKIANTGANGYIELDSTLSLNNQVGLNPSMTAFKSMYDEGMATIIQGVGYPSPNKSHFKSTDLWLSGGDGTAANFNLDGGWMGRYLSTAYPGVTGNPTSLFPDPLGIQLGDTKPSGGFHDHERVFMASNLSGQNPADLFGLLNDIGATPHATPIASEYGEMIDFIMETENSTNVYGERITNVYNAGANSSTTYPDTNLGDQLKTVARLLSGGSTTKIFLVHKTGFDTHAEQVQAGDTHLGDHASLLEDVFESIKAFHADLKILGIDERVTTCTFSEFGRKAVQNGSYGTDHGNLGPMFLFGAGANPGVIGTNVDLSNLTTSGELDPMSLQHDYRSLFKTLLQDWLGAGEEILSGTQFGTYTKIPTLVAASKIVSPDCYFEPAGVLPIELSAFTARVIDQEQVLVEWETASEVNLAYYEVEKSKDGIEFEKVALVFGKGERNTRQDYETIDEQPYSGISYYRLKSIDQDGKFDYSEVQVVELKSKIAKHIKLYPNPASFDTNLVMTLEEQNSFNLSIYRIDGKMVKSRELHALQGFNKFSIEVSDLEKGQYLFKLENGSEEITTMNLVVI